MFGYKPVIHTDEYFCRLSNIQKAGYNNGTSEHWLIVRQRFYLMPTETYKKWVKYIKPIPEDILTKFIEQYEVANSGFFKNGFPKMVKSMYSDEEMPKSIPVPEGFQDTVDKYRAAWKERLEAGNNQLLFQFNLKNSLIFDEWSRHIQAIDDEYTGIGATPAFKKISWFRYFLYEVPRHLVKKLYVKANNFYYRKEIEKEQEEDRKLLYAFRMALKEKK